MKFRYKNKDFNINVKRLSKLGMVLGLMFSSKKRAKALLFEYKNLRIHSFFVFYPFVALWLEGDKVVDFKIVKPFRLNSSSVKPSSKLIEIPINGRYKDIIQNLVGASTGKTFKKN